MKKIDNSVCLKDFGDRIKRARKAKGLSQAEVAFEAKIRYTICKSISEVVK